MKKKHDWSFSLVLIVSRLINRMKWNKNFELLFYAPFSCCLSWGKENTHKNNNNKEFSKAAWFTDISYFVYDGMQVLWVPNSVSRVLMDFQILSRLVIDFILLWDFLHFFWKQAISIWTLLFSDKVALEIFRTSNSTRKRNNNIIKVLKTQQFASFVPSLASLISLAPFQWVNEET